MKFGVLDEFLIRHKLKIFSQFGGRSWDFKLTTRYYLIENIIETLCLTDIFNANFKTVMLIYVRYKNNIQELGNIRKTTISCPDFIKH